ncbi:gliding motility-associated C-terminal domain-containing protein [Roseivirga sp. E12]|uniref:T9SS type B sorting domain-containing protein n=1 Tax=Roseivirga sp. E12 TaxID=2819237 RepID=UPI001ABD015F|nr:gliding motility-associated C-terminal domain-containing protein [Roseivirga sp. E12]MBO3699987.1 gliding motility-associated C-terminal domain-containing protein [Roseivirga sp. E12]
MARRAPFLEVILISVICLLFMTEGLSAQTIPIVKAEDKFCFEASQPLSLNNIVTIDGTGTDLLDGIQIAISQSYDATTDQLSYTDADGITGVFDSANGILTLSGSADLDTYNLALTRATFTTSATDNSTGIRAITISLSNLDYYPETGHFYKFFSDPGILWTAAATEAANKNLFGLNGYLATITTTGENQFILDRVSGTAWIGASDAAVEGVWRWVTGPEALQNNGEGRLLSDGFTNWENDEPNNLGPEHFAHMMDWSTPPGKWNDLRDEGGGGQYAPTGYIVEYGGQSGDPDVFSSITGTTTLDLSQNLEVVGTTSVCPNLMGVTYTAPDLFGYTYEWTVVGGTIDSGQGTSTLLVNWGPTNANASVSLKVKSAVICEKVFDLPVKVNVKLEPPLPLGPDAVCFMDLMNLQTYNTPSTPGSNYNWHITNGTIMGGNGTNEITVLWDGPGTGQLYFTESTTTATDICDGDSPLLTIDLREQVIPTFDIENVKCFEGSDGSISISAITGLAPFSYQWNVDNTATVIDNSVSDLKAGTYSVDITSAGCVVNIPFTITEPQPLMGSINVQDVLCFGEATGMAEAMITGGTGAYRYVWSFNPSANQAILTNIPRGDFSVDVYDENNCVLTLDFTINEPEQLVITDVISTLVSCPEGDDGTIEAFVTGGVLPYSYAWQSSSEATALATGFSKGTYRLVVTDANGCTVSASQSVDEAIPKVNFPTAFSPNGDNMNDTFGPTTPCQIEFNMEVYNSWGEVIFSTQNAQEQWNGQLNGQPLPPGKYSYIAVWTVEANGKLLPGQSKGVIRLIR